MIALASLLLLAYIAALNTIICRLVLRDAGAAQYRLDALKLQAGMFTRLGRNRSIIARSREQENDRSDEAGGDEFSHDLMMRVGADS